MTIDTRYRSEQKEIMDDMEMSGDLLADTLDRIAKINRQLGGNRLISSGVKTLLAHTPKEQSITIVDLGCGNGDILRMLAKWGRTHGRKFNLIGIDLNAFTISHAEAQSRDYPEVSYKTIDVFSEKMQAMDVDIVLATLFMHHFSNAEIERLLVQFNKQAQIGIVVNDLHRHKLAYRLFQLFSMTIRNPMIRNDGLISILRAFKRKDLEAISQKLKLKDDIRWRWAFRYQWIIHT